MSSHEERVVESQQLKILRYEQLVAACNQQYKVTVLTAEIGARRYVARRTQRMFSRLGIWSGKLHTAFNNAALRGSYAIYVHRNDPIWSWDVPVRGISFSATVL